MENSTRTAYSEFKRIRGGITSSHPQLFITLKYNHRWRTRITQEEAVSQVFSFTKKVARLNRAHILPFGGLDREGFENMGRFRNPHIHLRLDSIEYRDKLVLPTWEYGMIHTLEYDQTQEAENISYIGDKHMIGEFSIGSNGMQMVVCHRKGRCRKYCRIHKKIARGMLGG